jgi:hypothetical protein
MRRKEDAIPHMHRLNIKKCFLIMLCAAMLALAIAGCAVDLYHDKRPKLSETDIWISEEPAGYFIWLGQDESYCGEMILNGETYPISVSLDAGKGVDIYMRDGKETTAECTELLQAGCKFSTNQFVLKIKKSNSYPLSSYYKKIVFVRQDFDPEKETLPVLASSD